MKKAPKVLIISHSLTGGGAEQAMQNLAIALANSFEFYFLAIFSNGKDTEITYANSEILNLEKLRIFSLFKVIESGVKFNLRLRKLGPSAVIINCEAAETYFAFFAPRKTRSILVHHISERWAYPTRRSLGKLVRFLLEKRTVEHVFVSQALKKESNSIRGVCIENINNYTDLDKRPDFYNESIPRLIFIGRLHAQKNPAHVIKLGEKLNLDVVLYGEGPLRKELERLALKNKAKVTFRGFVPMPWSEINLYDIIILPSKYEGKPLVLQEAVYRGNRVITYNHSYLVAEFQELGVLFAKNYEHLLEKLGLLIGSNSWMPSSTTENREKLNSSNRVAIQNWEEKLKEICVKEWEK